VVENRDKSRAMSFMEILLGRQLGTMARLHQAENDHTA